MAHVIAVAGKGGVGKTTLCGMLIQYLCEKGNGPILAVDADANSNLNEVLGVEVETTLGDVREEIARAELASENPIPAGMSKADYAERRFEDALVEDDDFDLLVMGRTQGKGCYCFVNGLLQTQNDGTTKIMDFFDEQRMCHLYEKFLLEYYRKEHPELSANASQIAWQLDDSENQLLPKMQTDIMLSQGNNILIIDAK